MSAEVEDSGDELYQLTQKALFVEYPTRPIDLDTVPRDGSEFIHKSRLEEANLPCNQVEDASSKSAEENEQKHMRQRARNAAAEFSRYALKLTCDKFRKNLKKKFPKKLKVPRHGPASIQEWCVLCLGSKLCSEIYGEQYEKPSEEIKGNPPVLSIIVHFNQYTAKTVLAYLHEWFLKVGMRDSIGAWVYAVLSCIIKPLQDDTKSLIKSFYFDCKKRLKDCDESERSRLYLISTIMEYYFCIHSDEIGPALESFLSLTI